MKETVEHVLRPKLPWRTESDRTECGHAAAEFATVLTRDQLFAKVKQQGKQRAALSTCMTCMDTAARWAGWADSPHDVVRREVSGGWGHRGDRTKQLDVELRALEMLVDRHREEFDEAVRAMTGATSLADARARKAYERHVDRQTGRRL